MLNSSVANDKTARLQTQYNDDRTMLNEQALAEATNARKAVENTRLELQSQLAATADPSAAASNAIAQSKILTSSNSYQPLGDLFGNMGDALNNYAGAATGYRGLLGVRAPSLTMPASGCAGASRTVG
jgi:hypothetical protein